MLIRSLSHRGGGGEGGDGARHDSRTSSKLHARFFIKEIQGRREKKKTHLDPVCSFHIP